MSEDYEDIVLSELPDDELIEQMHDDLYDGLKEEIVEGTDILLGGNPEMLAQAVADGVITQEQADAMLEHLSEEVLERLQGEYSFGGPGLGGRGHHGGFGPGGMMPGSSPTLPDESES